MRLSIPTWTFEPAAALGRRLWITTLLWVVGRTLCRAARRKKSGKPPGRTRWYLK